MSTKRIVSMGSNVYHRLDCRYVKAIKRENRITSLKTDLIYNGCRPCRCCNGMDHIYKTESDEISRYAKKHGMELNYIDGILYVKTNVGCWKLVYSRSQEKIAIYHRNATSRPINFEHPQYEHYHRQTDILYVPYIMKCLSYIKEHDRFREAEKNGIILMDLKNGRHRKNAEKAKRKAERKHMDSLFDLIESQLGMSAVSCC